MNARKGFALITVLWILVITGAIAAAGAVAGNDAAGALRNRINATRATWRANACGARARFGIDRALAETSPAHRDSVWRSLAQMSDQLNQSDSTCSVAFEAAGDRLDINTATATEIERVLEALGVGGRDSLVDAVLDWIDIDETPRPSGAEANAYMAATRRAPRNGRIADAAELGYVMGFASLDFAAVFGVDSARISIATAPLPVLAALPGFSAEVVAVVGEWRAVGRQVTNLLVLADAVSASARERIMASYPELMRRATIDPEAWIVRASGSAGWPVITQTLELRLARAESRAAVLARRVW